MTHLRRSPVLILALIALLAACSSAGTSSAAPPASSAAPAAAAAALVRGEFVGDAGDLAGIALSTNGRQVIGYLCDGTSRHVSLAQWFTGPVVGAGIDITNARGAHLVATVTAQAITGTVTLNDGRSAPFTARLLPDPGRTYGLFRSEHTFRGVRYLGGWIFNPPSFASTRVGAGASAGVTLTAALRVDPVGFQPLRGGIGIINEQTGALIVSPVPGNLVSVTVPGVGTFRLTHCLRARC
jgi:hypothetical protein